MKKIKIPGFLYSYRTKITIVLILSMILSGCLFNLFIYRYTVKSQFNQLREKLMLISQMAALSIDGDLLLQVPLNKEGVNTRAYKVIYNQLVRIKKANPILRYVYTMTRTDKKGLWQFIVDPDADELKKLGITSYPGDVYDASRFSEMMKAFAGPSADTHLERDEWGVLLSGYAPVFSSNGMAVAIIGVDIRADDVSAIQQEVRRREMFILIFGVLFALFVGILLSNKLTSRINKLVEGTEKVRAGDLSYQVTIEGNDEISLLAHAFNIMTKSLFLTRKQVHKYFYRAMQSLVRVLEAKDIYTMGHSDRVAEYVVKIAKKMKLPEESIDLLRDASRLHDIGKLCIQKTILNKDGRLTDEEWQIIREHPVVGEDILRPVVFDKQILSIVRLHHERFDGSGYPDRLKGDGINLFAQITSVADAYDAMTSDRAYRKALTREEAVNELIKNKSTQFNPEIVDVFIEVLEEDDT